MTTKEFSERFDTLLQSHRGFNKSIAQNILDFDEYEKSVFLTKSQNNIINKLAQEYEINEDVRRKLARLVKTTSYTSSIPSVNNISLNSNFFVLPSDLIKIVYESIKIRTSSITFNSTFSETFLLIDHGTSCFDGKDLTVVPVTHDEYNNQKDNPFRKPKLKGLTNNAWRLDTGEDTESVEIILPELTILNKYTIRYIRTPNPIILTNLGELEIEGISEKTECELDSFLLHETILEQAVQLALSAISILSNK
jgi:hypothetical protein